MSRYDPTDDIAYIRDTYSLDGVRPFTSQLRGAIHRLADFAEANLNDRPTERNEIVSFLASQANEMLNQAASILIDAPQSGQAINVLMQAGVVMSMAVRVARGQHMPETINVAEG